MLDYLLVFSLEKLVFDNEMCGQALHFVREFKPLEDLPTVDLVRQLLAEEHMLTTAHTLKYWPDQLYLPSPIIDRFTREDWLKTGRLSLEERAHKEVGQRLAAYTPVETDPETEAEMRRLIRSGMTEDNTLPEIPGHRAPSPLPQATRRQNRRRKRRGLA